MTKLFSQKLIISHRGTALLSSQMRRLGSIERPLFWNISETELYPYAVTPQNQKESNEITALLDSFNGSIVKPGENDKSSFHATESLLSTCIPSKYGGVDHTAMSRVYLLDQMQTVLTQRALRNSSALSESAVSQYLYHTLYVTLSYLSEASDTLREAFLEKLFQQMRTKEALCTVCAHDNERMYDATTCSTTLKTVDNNNGATHTIHGVTSRVPFADVATHFIIPARVEVTEPVADGDEDAAPVTSWKSIVCIVPKNQGVTVEKIKNQSSTAQLFTVRFETVEIIASDSFLCQPGEGIALRNAANASSSMVQTAIIMGKLRGVMRHLQALGGEDMKEADKQAFIRISSLVYALETALQVAARETDAKEERTAAITALRVFAATALQTTLQTVELCENDSANISAVIQKAMSFMSQGESPLTTQHILACLTLEDTALHINNTSTLELMQQRALKSVGIGKRIRHMRDAVEKAKARAPAASRSKWLTSIDERLTEVEAALDMFREFTEKFIGKSGNSIAHTDFQVVSGFIRIEVELFVRFCVLSRAFGAIESKSMPEEHSMLAETFCALSQKVTKQLFAYYHPQGKEVPTATLDVNLDGQIFNDIFLRTQCL